LYCYRKRKHKHDENTIDDDHLTAILESIPNELYQPSWSAAFLHLGAAVTLLAVSVVLFVTFPWPFIPVAWTLAAAALVMLFNIGHDCAHKNFSPSQMFNNIIGELAFLPLVHPYQAFRYKHLNNNKLLKSFDLAPKGKLVGAHAPSLLASLGLRGFLLEHYDVSSFPPQFQARVSFSVVLSVAFLLLFLGLLRHFHGAWGILCYWLVPLLLYKDVLHARWLEWARRGCDLHLPARVASSVPSYRLRAVSRIVLDHLNPSNKGEAEEERLRTLHEDAIKQKEGGKARGYDHEYGEEVLSEGFKSVGDFLRQLNWVNVVILIGTPIVGIYGILTTPLQWRTLAMAVAYYFFTGLGITAGYHRLWAHRSYQASFVVRMLLLLGGTGALEGSIKWWCGGHRVHHRYTDTPKDPYNAKFGFWWAHMGWMLMKPDRKYKVKADIRDLQADPWINFQHTHYAWLGPFIAFVLPTLICGLGWGDYRGGYFYVGALRLLFVHHSTFCVNSVAHFFGSHTYDDDRTPRDHIVTAFLTLGEGYHNFHHEFPNDYRNGIRSYDYDPTKWLIKGCSLFGLTYNLKEFPQNEVAKGKLMMKQKQLDREKAKLRFPGPVASLPAMSWDTLRRKVREGQALVVVDGLVHDVTHFMDEHPGGVPLLQAVIGKDGTAHFRGETGVYRHSNAAKHLLTTFRVARLEDGEQKAQDGEQKEDEAAAKPARRRSKRANSNSGNDSDSSKGGAGEVLAH